MADLPCIAVFVSGGGRTLANLIRCVGAGEVRARIGLVVGSRVCGGLEIARDAGIATAVADEGWGAGDVERCLDGAGATLAVLAGYLRKLAIPDAYSGRVVNIHPALLPAHGGEGMYGDRVHRAVLEAGDRESGCTVHIADAEYDRGRIVAQARCPVLSDDTVGSLAARVFALELELYPAAIDALLNGEDVEDRFRPATLRSTDSEISD